MSLINFIRLVSPNGETWEHYARQKWGVRVTRWHGWLDGTREKAWTKILSRPDASLRWKALQKKGWRETVRRNPEEKWTKIGEWWIDDSGTALYADGDVGDMGHEAYVIDLLTRRLLNAMDIDTDDEHVGNLSDKENRKLIQAHMKEEEFDGTIEEFVEEAAKSIWKDKRQREDAIDIADGRGDARKYGMQYDGWIRVAGHGFECWNITKEVLKRMGDGIHDAGVEDIDPEEIFEIYDHNTKTHYQGVPWSVISEEDMSALRGYAEVKRNPPKGFSLNPIEGAKQLAAKYGIQAMGWARTFASACKANAEKQYWKAVYHTLSNQTNPAPHVPVMSYGAAHRWEALAKSKRVSAVARSPRGFMRAYEKAGTWARLDPWWKARRNAFVARHMAQVRQNGEKLWKPSKSGALQPSRRALALLMWGFMPPGRR
jgi:hypothetical protein